jgi:hypothetical protein
MGLLIQCLRDVRARSGDLDLLPPFASGGSHAADLLLGRDQKARVDADSPSEADPGPSLAHHANWRSAGPSGTLRFDRPSQ